MVHSKAYLFEDHEWGALDPPLTTDYSDTLGLLQKGEENTLLLFIINVIIPPYLWAVVVHGPL